MEMRIRHNGLNNVANASTIKQFCYSVYSVWDLKEIMPSRPQNVNYWQDIYTGHFFNLLIQMHSIIIRMRKYFYIWKKISTNVRFFFLISKKKFSEEVSTNDLCFFFKAIVPLKSYQWYVRENFYIKIHPAKIGVRTSPST